jgi:7-carboxy-7-deazaguanine synthase
VFVRLTACDLRCTWCDTPYAFTEGRKRTVEEVVDEVAAFGCPLVELTGGEPLLQEDVYPLMTALLGRGLTVLLETGGHISVERVPDGVVKIVDVKCPGSGESARNHWPILDRLGPRDQVKFVIQDRADYEFAREVARRHALAERCGAVLFSPVHGVLAPAELAAWILADRLPVRLQLQVHKYIWGAHARGV